MAERELPSSGLAVGQAQDTEPFDPIRDVIAGFRMPPAGAIPGYWRRALRIADTARSDHTDAYEHLIKVLNRAVDAPGERWADLTSFVESCRTIG